MQYHFELKANPNKLFHGWDEIIPLYAFRDILRTVQRQLIAAFESA